MKFNYECEKYSISSITTSCILTAFLITCAVPVFVSAGEIQSRSFPLPVRIDSQYYIKSSMFVKCDVKMYDVGFKDFSTIYDEPSETKFKQLVFAIRQGDLNKCLALSRIKPEAVDKYREMSQVAIQGYGRLLDPTIVGQNFEKIRVTERFHVGDDVIFIWGLDSFSPLNRGPLRRGFRFVKNHSGEVLWSPEPPDTVMSILTSIAQQRAENPTIYTSSKPIQLQYNYPLTQKMEEHNIFLCFNGIPCDANVFNDDISHNDIISFYQKAYRTFRNRPALEFAELYTERSRDKFLNWYSTLDPNMVIMYRNNIINNERKIFFVLNGDPVFIVFYYHPDSDNSVDILKRIRYEYIVRDKGCLKLTNFFYEDFLDDLLQDNTLFIEPVLGSFILQKTNNSHLEKLR